MTTTVNRYLAAAADEASARAELHTAIYRARATEGRDTPCRLSPSYDADDLDPDTAGQLVDRCRTQCPVLTECAALAATIPAHQRIGVVLAGQYSPPLPWRALYEQLRDEIETGVYQPGDRLPRPARLCETHACGHSAVNLALEQLERDGLVVVDVRRSYGRLVVAYGAILGARQAALVDGDRAAASQDQAAGGNEWAA